MSEIVKAAYAAPVALKPHFKGLLTRDVRTRVAAAEALGASGYLPAAEAMIERLEGESSVAVVHALLLAIQKLSPGLANRAGRIVTRDPRPAHAEIGREFLATLPGLPHVDEPDAVARILATPSLVESATGFGELGCHLRSANPKVRELVIQRLADLYLATSDRAPHQVAEDQETLLSEIRSASPEIGLKLLRVIGARDQTLSNALARRLCLSHSSSLEHCMAGAEIIICDSDTETKTLLELVEGHDGQVVTALATKLACYRFTEAMNICKLRVTSASEAERLQATRIIGLLGKYSLDDPHEPAKALLHRRDQCAEVLVPLLQDRAGTVRKLALLALNEQKLPNIAQLARRALPDKNNEVRALAVEILGEHAASTDLKLVWARREDSSSDVRKAALQASVAIAPERRTEIALSFIMDGDPAVSEAAAKIVGETETDKVLAAVMCIGKLKSAAGDSGRIMLELIQKLDPDALPDALQNAEGLPNPYARLGLVHFLNKHAVHGEIAVLKRLTSDPDDRIKSAAFDVLVKKRGPGWRDAVKSLLQNGDWKQQRQVALVIGRHGNQQDLSTLRSLLSHARDEVREAAFDAIAKLSPVEAETVAWQMVTDMNGDIASRALNLLVATGAASIGINDLISKLSEAKGESGRRILSLIRNECPHHFDRAIRAAVTTQNAQTRLALIEFLRDGFSPDRQDILLTLSRDRDDDVRVNAIEAVYELMPADKVVNATRALADKNSQIRREALNALTGVDDPSLVVDVLPLARDEDWTVREAAIVNLAKYDDIRVFSELISSLNDVEQDVRDMAKEILEAGPEKVPVLRRFADMHGTVPLWERVRTRVDMINAWASQIGQELLGRPVIVHQYRQSIGRTPIRKKHLPVEIEVSDYPVTQGHIHGEEIMMGIALHEIGHHVADTNQRGSSTMRGIARSEGLGEIYDILIDERLERIMRSRRPEWGVYFDRLASYVFAQNDHAIALSDYAGFLGMLPHKVRQAIQESQLPGRIVPARDPANEDGVILRDSDFLSIPGAMPPLAGFLACLRCGFDPKLCADPKVPEAIALVPHNLKDLPHSEVLEAARQIGKVIGKSNEHKRRMNQWVQQMREQRAAMAALQQILDRMRETGHVPDWLRQGASGIRNNPPPSTTPPPTSPRTNKLSGGQDLNLGKELKFDELTKEESLPFDPVAQVKLVTAIRPHIRVLRRYLERLGIRTVDEYAEKRGRRLDMARVKHAIWQRRPNMLVHSREELAPDLYLGVLIDQSGSMAGEKIKKAKAFAALVAESAKGLRGIAGHVNAFDDDTFYRLGDFEHNSVASLESGGGNNDAGALFKASQLALQSGKTNRLLIMISDGSPTECTVASLRALVARLTQNQGFVCAQVAVDEIEEICFPQFVDLTKYPLDEAVGRFGKLLMKLTAAWR